MDIGSKLKTARQNAGLTQEQVAEALGVSRQSVSNWETSKTYPDIVSVVKFSDLCSVSLDHLLKEEKNDVNNYLNHLSETTNAVKSRKKLISIILIATYMGIWAFAILFFWCFTSPGDAMAYSLIFQQFVLPAATVTVSLLLSKQDTFGRWKWLSPFVFAALFTLADYATFSMKNMLAFHKVNVLNFIYFCKGEVIALIGIAIGHILLVTERNAAAKNTNNGE